MVKFIAKSGWPTNPDDLKAKVLEVWDNLDLESIRTLILGYRVRLQCILSVKGDRHPDFA